MKKLILLLFFFASTVSFAQTRKDSLHLLQQTASLYDLDFTEAETDSLLANVLAAKSIMQRMHQEMPSNDLPFPFAFHPTPPGFSIPVKQQKIAWDIPATVALPKNK